MKLTIVTLISFLFSQKIFSAQEFNIGVLYWSMNIEGQVIMREGLEQKARNLNLIAKKNKRPTFKLIPYVAGDGAKGIANQVAQFKNLIDQKVDLIIVQPTDNAALSDALVLANKANIPVITYDQYIVGGKITSFITSNNYQAGFLDGEYIASLFDNEKTINLILVEYPKVSSTIDRVDGFFNALKKYKQKYKIIGTYNAVEPKSGKVAVDKILKRFPKKNSIDVIFTVNDGGGLSIVEGLHKAGRTEIKVATVDGDPKSQINIKNNNLTVIDSAQFCAELGRQSIEIAYKVLNKEKVPSKVLIPTFPITKETIKFYPGWRAQIPKTFKKSWYPFDNWDNEIKGLNGN